MTEPLVSGSSPQLDDVMGVTAGAEVCCHF